MMKSLEVNPSGPDVRFWEVEAAHIPTSIQPHGALLAVQIDGLIVTHASANCELIMGLALERVLGQPLADLIGESACGALMNYGKNGEIRLACVTSIFGPNGSVLFLRSFQTGKHLCVDIESPQIEPLQKPPIFDAGYITEMFAHANNMTELCEFTARGLWEISGFDRVLTFRFCEDGNGEVVAEACNEPLDSYLGQHLPASNIPTQFGQHFPRQRVEATADANTAEVPLCAYALLDDGARLDLTGSALSSASPEHREYLRTVAASASLTIVLTHGPKLWGMVMCQHSVPRIVGPELRACAELIGQVASLMLGQLQEVEIQADRTKRLAILRRLSDKIAVPRPILEGLTSAHDELLHLVDAAGAAVRISGTYVYLGQLPPAAEVERAVAVLEPLAGVAPLAIGSLALRFPQLASYAKESDSVLIMSLASGKGDFILWFRPECLRASAWGPAKPTALGAGRAHLSPRLSLAAAEESFFDCAPPWTQGQVAVASEFYGAFENEISRRTKDALLESQAELGLLVEHSGDVVIFLGFDSIRRYVSPAVEPLLGWRPDEMVGSTALLGTKPTDFVHTEDLQAYLDARKAMQTDRVSETAICFRHLRRDGGWQWVDSRARLRLSIGGSGPEGIVVTLRDATERKTLEFKLIDALAQMESMALTDGLTGLANRRHLKEVAESEWRRCARDRRPLSILLLDADRFKYFNDRYGHMAGDECLRAIASQLRAATLRPADFAARYGGEEFLLLLPQTDCDGALVIAERVRKLVSGLDVAHLDNVDHRIVTVSIGAATALPGSPTCRLRSIDELLASADAALYLAKSRGRNQVVVGSS